jgi:hypothetical protein
MIPDCIFGVTGHVQDPSSRIPERKLAREFRAFHAGHDDICQKEVHPSIVHGGSAQGVRATWSGENRVASAPQDFLRHTANGGIVFDKQNRFTRGIEVQCSLYCAQIYGRRDTRQQRLKFASRA